MISGSLLFNKMKKTLLIIGIIFIFGCSDEEVPISLPETIRVKETVVVEVTKVVEKEKIIYLDATYNPNPTWTPTPTPKPSAKWTPTPIPMVKSTWTPTPTPITMPTWTPTPTPTSIPTWTPTPTITPTVPGWEFYLDGQLVTPTPSPPSTWTPTPTPKAMPTWTPTPTPTPLPPGDLGYELTSVVTSVNLIEFGQVINIGIPEDKSPIVDSNQNNDLTDEITTNDDANYRIMSVTSQKSGISIVNLIALTPIGNTQITLTFHTLRR